MSLTWNGIKSSSKILEFNPDHITIPHDKFNNKNVLSTNFFCYIYSFIFNKNKKIIILYSLN